MRDLAHSGLRKHADVRRQDGDAGLLSAWRGIEVSAAVMVYVRAGSVGAWIRV